MFAPLIETIARVIYLSHLNQYNILLAVEVFFNRLKKNTLKNKSKPIDTGF